MKIIYLHPHVFPNNSANSIQVINMCNSFQTLGFSTILYCLYKNKQPSHKIKKYYGVKSDFSIRQIFRFIFLGRNISKYILLFNAIFSNINNKDLFFYTRDWKYSIILSIFNFRNILEMHYLPQEFFFFKLINLVMKKKNFLQLITISNNLKNDLIKFKINKKKLSVHHDGAKKNMFVQNKNFFINSKPQICYIGSFMPGKGLEIIIKLAKKLKSITFNVYGGSSTEINFFKSKYFKINNLIFHGYVSNYKVRNILKNHDIALLPYQRIVKSHGHKNIARWMSPLKLFEYMASKMIIISSNHSVIREVLNSNNAYIVKNSNNVGSWQIAINEIIKNKKKYILKANQAYFDSFNHTWENRAKKISLFFK